MIKRFSLHVRLNCRLFHTMGFISVGPYVGRRSEHAYHLIYMEESISTVFHIKKQMTRVFNKIQSSYERIGSFSLVHTIPVLFVRGTMTFDHHSYFHFVCPAGFDSFTHEIRYSDILGVTLRKKHEPWLTCLY